MKGKKSAFSNTSTGYGKTKSSHNHKHHNNNSKQERPDSKTADDNKVVHTEQNDKDLNSGFGDYLRSPEAIEMMKLFVFANSIMLILTMAWPNIKETYYIFMACHHNFIMVGPFMQGMLLMGIIYWYSKGIFNLINDYYRSEFQRKLKTDEPQSYRNTYDTDDIINLIQTENLNNLNKETNEIVKNIMDNQFLHDTPKKSGKLINVCKKTISSLKDLIMALPSIVSAILLKNGFVNYSPVNKTFLCGDPMYRAETQEAYLIQHQSLKSDVHKVVFPV